MNNIEAARKLDALEKALKELQEKINTLSRNDGRDAALASLYPASLDTAITTAVPWWVRDLFMDECFENFEAKTEESLHCGRLSMGHAIRFAVFHAIKNPDTIEYVSLKELRQIKSRNDTK